MMRLENTLILDSCPVPCGHLPACSLLYVVSQWRVCDLFTILRGYTINNFRHLGFGCTIGGFTSTKIELPFHVIAGAGVF